MKVASTLLSCRPFAQSTIIAVIVWLLQVVVGAIVLKVASLELLKEPLHQTYVQSGNLALVLTIVSEEAAKRARISRVLFPVPLRNAHGAARPANAFGRKLLLKAAQLSVRLIP
jgi:hypothetical protein